jgi:hypothetical protein
LLQHVAAVFVMKSCRKLVMEITGFNMPKIPFLSLFKHNPTIGITNEVTTESYFDPIKIGIRILLD